jgi:alpha-tubulin suppressor-like RCC1 family protein
VPNLHLPNLHSSRSLIIKDVALGYAHSLFLTVDGQLYGCGHMDNGELISDPQNLPKICGGKPKTWQLLKLDLPEPIDMIACGYFHGLAVSRTAIYQWGESPQTLKMNAFWQKRQNAKCKLLVGYGNNYHV